MEGLVRYLLLNPAGEQLTTYQSVVNWWVYRHRHGAPWYFFHRTPSFYLTARCPQDANSPVWWSVSVCGRHARHEVNMPPSFVLDNSLILMTSVMGFIKKWLTNQNVILGNSVLAEVQTFADAVNGSNSLRELALEILQCIPDKVRFVLVIYCSQLSNCRQHRIFHFPRPYLVIRDRTQNPLRVN